MQLNSTRWCRLCWQFFFVRVFDPFKWTHFVSIWHTSSCKMVSKSSHVFPFFCHFQCWKQNDGEMARERFYVFVEMIEPSLRISQFENPLSRKFVAVFIFHLRCYLRWIRHCCVAATLFHLFRILRKSISNCLLVYNGKFIVTLNQVNRKYIQLTCVVQKMHKSLQSSKKYRGKHRQQCRTQTKRSEALWLLKVLREWRGTHSQKCAQSLLSIWQKHFDNFS